jgi:hypothetical protein
VPQRSALIGGLAAALLAAGALASPAGSAAEPAASAGPAATSEPLVLSNESTFSRWAHVTRTTTVHAEPNAGSRVLKKLGSHTHDRTRELVLALEQVTNGGGTWMRVRFSVRPNGLTGWVNSLDLGRLHVVTTFLKIKRKKFRAILFDQGKRVWSSRIGVGKRGTITPPGRFYVRELLIPKEKGGIYGPFAFGTSATAPTLSDWPGGGIVGIHGTNQPGLIPGRISHGCIRVRNRAVNRLRRLMPIGTPIRIY